MNSNAPKTSRAEMRFTAWITIFAQLMAGKERAKSSGTDRTGPMQRAEIWPFTFAAAAKMTGRRYVLYTHVGRFYPTAN